MIKIVRLLAVALTYHKTASMTMVSFLQVLSRVLEIRIGLAESWLAAVVVAAFHELEALGVLHGRLILDGFLVFLVVECDRFGVEVKHLSQLVGNISADLLIPAILQPHFK